jgi:hypothetical protein
MQREPRFILILSSVGATIGVFLGLGTFASLALNSPASFLGVSISHDIGLGLCMIAMLLTSLSFLGFVHVVLHQLNRKVKRTIVQHLHAKRAAGCCIECGYDLRMNNSGICPECGRRLGPISRGWSAPERGLR